MVMVTGKDMGMNLILMEMGSETEKKKATQLILFNNKQRTYKSG